MGAAAAAAGVTRAIEPGPIVREAVVAYALRRTVMLMVVVEAK
jgi:hypothetical protein